MKTVVYCWWTIHRQLLVASREAGMAEVATNVLHNVGNALNSVNVSTNLITTHVDVAVIDNGIGIAPENLTGIFNHGFTTRADGHGFGLHGAALAARELGGSLSVHSDGIGHGATFSLRLPLRVQDLGAHRVIQAVPDCGSRVIDTCRTDETTARTS